MTYHDIPMRQIMCKHFFSFCRRGCAEACYCNDTDMVLRGDKCVQKTDCPCYFEGKEYEKGSTRIEKCNTW